MAGLLKASGYRVVGRSLSGRAIGSRSFQGAPTKPPSLTHWYTIASIYQAIINNCNVYFSMLCSSRKFELKYKLMML